MDVDNTGFGRYSSPNYLVFGFRIERTNFNGTRSVGFFEHDSNIVKWFNTVLFGFHKMKNETDEWVEHLLMLAKKRGVRMKTVFEKRFLCDWIRDDCLLRKMPEDEIETAIKKHII